MRWNHMVHGTTRTRRDWMESALAVIVGIGLAASCGFRVFVPLLVVSGAANAGYLDVAENLQLAGDAGGADGVCGGVGRGDRGVLCAVAR